MSQKIKVCTDRILPKDLMRLQPAVRTREGRERAIAPIGKTWMNGSTLHVQFMGGSSTEQDVAREQADWWAQVANLKFDFNNAKETDAAETPFRLRTRWFVPVRKRHPRCIAHRGPSALRDSGA